VSITWALDAGDGPRGVRIDVVVPAASTVKPLIAIALWQEIHAGGIDPDEVVSDGYPLAGGNSLVDALPGIRLRLRDACTLMLAVSDNTTSNLLLDRLGFDRVNAQAAALGLQATSLGRRFMDAAAVERGDENWTSAGDLVGVLRALAVPGQLADEVRMPVLDGLAASQHLDILGEVVPEERLLAVKAGWHEQALHDSGLIGPPAVAKWPRGHLANWPGGRLAIWPDAPLAFAICSSPPASKDALRATARTVLEPFLV
jgi:beta-lactamase class A